jgi:heme A synthase
MTITWIHRLTTALVLSTALLLAISGFMVSERTGLPVPAWAQGGQMAHRVAAGVVGLLALAVLVFALRVRGWQWGKRLALGAFLVVLAQAALGMVLARGGASAAVSVLQAMLMHGLVSVTSALLLLSSRSYTAPSETVEDEMQPPLRSLAWWPTAFVVLQIALGSAYRHGMLNVIPHLFGAFVVAGALAFLAILVATTYPQHRDLKRVSFTVVWFTISQIVLGLVALFYRAQVGAADGVASWWVLFTVGHVVLGSFTLAATVWMALQIRKYVRPAELPVQATGHAGAVELGTKLS